MFVAFCLSGNGSLEATVSSVALGLKTNFAASFLAFLARPRGKSAIVPFTKEFNHTLVYKLKLKKLKGMWQNSPQKQEYYGYKNHKQPKE